MTVFTHPLYRQDIQRIAALPFDWNRLRGKTFVIAGASGMIGSMLIDVLMYRNRTQDMNCHVLALGRNPERGAARFAAYRNDPLFRFLAHDINTPLEADTPADFLLHAASNTHPVAYATDPIGTVTANIIGTDNLLRFASAHGTERVLFASSVEVYGENRGDVDAFSENYCGYINCNTLRAGYPESKRAGEALCQAYIRQNGLDIVLPRLARTYGPTMLNSDTKAISQFIKKGVNRENIVLKSEGTQFFSYTYAADAVSGLLTVLFRGACGEAYNIADARSDIALRDLAQLIADYAGTDVVFELPDATERAGYSTATRAVLNPAKLRSLGWQAQYTIKSGLERTIEILRAGL
ncbi:MAG: NAD-dependent epimerase/dehydratase family protein [Butyricicoccaceae bacterium]